MKLLRALLLGILLASTALTQISTYPSGASPVPSGTEDISLKNLPKGSGNYYFWKRWLENHYNPEQIAGTNFVMLDAIQNAYDGGHNLYGASGPYYDKTNW